jgi:hypothetical protein
MFCRKPDWNRATDNLERVFTPGQCIFKDTCITCPVVVKGGRKTEKEEVAFAVEVFELDTWRNARIRANIVDIYINRREMLVSEKGAKCGVCEGGIGPWYYFRPRR